MYSGSHQLQLSKFSYESEMRSEQLAEQIAEQMEAQTEQIKQSQAQVEQAQAEANHIKAQADQAQEQANRIKAEADQAKAQAEKTSSEVTGLRNVLRDDFKTIGSKFKSADTAISVLTARLEAADQERTWMANHMKIKTLAEAESHELMAKRLRESVLGPDAGSLLQGGMARLQLTAESSQQHRRESGARRGASRGLIADCCRRGSSGGAGKD
jgi:chromosome segregation ATPase